MNLKTTLVLMVLVALVLVVWKVFLVGGPDPSLPGMGSPLFPNLLTSEVDEISLQDAGGERLSKAILLRRNEEQRSHWMVVAEHIEGGRPVLARTQVVEEILNGVQALTPLRLMNDDPDDEEIVGLGLDPRRVLSISLRGKGMTNLGLEFGASLGTGELVCRRSGQTAVFAVPKEILRKLVPDPEHLPNPLLVRMDVLDVQSITIEAPDRPTLEIDRSHARWFIRRPFEDVPGDSVRCDELRAAILGLTVRGRIWDPEEVARLIPTPPTWRIILRGESATSVQLDLGDARDGRVPARLEGEDHAVIIGDDILARLAPDYGLLRDRRVIDAPSARILAAEVIGGDESRRFTLQRIGPQRFRIKLDARDGRPVEAADTDGVAIGNWLDRLRELALSGYRTEDVAFPPDLQVRLTLGSAGSTDQETTGFDLGPPDDTGNRSIRILGQGGTGTLSSEAAAFLFEPYWTLRDRSIWCTHAYFNLARIQITDAAGKTVELEGRIPPKHDGKHQDLILARRVEGVLRDLDPSQQKPLVNLMIGGLTTSGYMGEGKREDMGFDDPHLVVRWFEPENASMDGIPNDGPGTWRSLTIGGMRRADGRYYGVVDGSADLVFLVGSEDILPFFNLLQ